MIPCTLLLIMFVFFFQVEDLRSDTEESDTQLVDSETVELNGNVCKESINS